MCYVILIPELISGNSPGEVFMARTCTRCGSIVIEDGSIQTTEGIVLRFLARKEGKRLRVNLGPVKSAICPKCGEISVYVTDLDRLRGDGAL